ncbi:galactosylceramide sulfotransferase [Lingula anatina]|uniref:Galactosylceramide sulfotransferase n=1 Tax=Lingula anatina TaxID=7574 RepID=A0A1S3I059_LINAN|nr:galactosylceramide sulfotransferase [Lingula anatina]XP_013390732.1 galactosylceramide sulfotransferase [Lingula anatina]XP_013390733.1 galactosylceramide sulfotransferase [Lingula anatina]XP_013390734.1 galactosylceramide sulfotransferase [Lingula anatina]XP_013390735.1 galactosylceramide sulfotransferase [Lingula anatina]|eukprot:XP_013390731.1 galactosylceramide sulfotransferase [Lingula anatina]
MASHSMIRTLVLATLVFSWPLVYFVTRFSIEAHKIQILMPTGSNDRIRDSCQCNNVTSLSVTSLNLTSPPVMRGGESKLFSPNSSNNSNDIRLPVTSLVFLKTHKTASSTVQNIVMRFGYQRGLVFALGAERNMYQVGNFPAIFKPTYALRSAAGKFNILCHHTRFSRDIQKIMQDGAVYFTILRNPTSVFESIFSYYNIAQVYKLNATNGLATFLERPKYYFTFPIPDVDAALRNPLLVDFGMNVDMSDNITAIYEKILELEQNFDLVMIAEYFDESLILLKHLLNWSLTDLVNVRLNARPKQKIVQLDPGNLAKMKSWNAGDHLLYDHFNRTFWRKIKLFGVERLQKEVEELRKINQYWKAVCYDKETNVKAKGLQKYTEVVTYKLSQQGSKHMDCSLMSLQEIEFSDLIYERMLKRGQILDKRPPKWHGKKQ